MRIRPFQIIILFMGTLAIGVGAYFILNIVNGIAQAEELAKAKMEAPVEERKGLPLVSLDEIYANVETGDKRSRFMVMKLDLELFDESGREMIERFQTPIRDAVLLVAREQKYKNLETIAGKLYFKEIIIAQINELLMQATVRDLHFATFYLH